MIEEIPKEEMVDEILIIKFSDGIFHIGSLGLTSEEVIAADAGWFNCNS